MAEDELLEKQLKITREKIDLHIRQKEKYVGFSAERSLLKVKEEEEEINKWEETENALRHRQRELGKRLREIYGAPRSRRRGPPRRKRSWLGARND